MKKVLAVEGMMCEHCVKHVETALSKVEGVEKVKVELKKKRATVTLNGDVPNEKLQSAVEEAGYTVKGIE